MNMRFAKSFVKPASEPLKVTYIEATEEMGGAEHLLIDLIQEFPRNHVEPLLVSPGGGELSKRARSVGIPCQSVSIPIFASTSWIWRGKRFFNPLAISYDAVAVLTVAKRLTSTLKANPPDVIHTNSMMAHFFGALAARRLGIPCIWHMHDTVNGNRLWGLAKFFWEKLALRLPTKIVGASRHCVQILGNSEKTKVIYMGIEDSLCKQNQSIKESWHSLLGLSPDDILVGYVGRIGQNKGLKFLIHAAKRICDQNSNVHFVLVGAPMFGEVDYQRQLNDLIEELNLTSHIHLVGYFSDAAHRLDEFRCLVLPSLRETFPLVLLEAGVASKAVVATQVGGVPEIVIDGKTGLLVASRDVEALARALGQLIHNPDLASRLGKQARQHVVDNFHIHSTVEQWISLYKEVLIQ